MTKIKIHITLKVQTANSMNHIMNNLCLITVLNKNSYQKRTNKNFINGKIYSRNHVDKNRSSNFVPILNFIEFCRRIAIYRS